MIGYESFHARLAKMRTDLSHTSASPSLPLYYVNSPPKKPKSLSSMPCKASQNSHIRLAPPFFMPLFSCAKGMSLKPPCKSKGDHAHGLTVEGAATKPPYSPPLDIHRTLYYRWLLLPMPSEPTHQYDL